jgi:hypothetical protein
MRHYSLQFITVEEENGWWIDGSLIAVDVVIYVVLYGYAYAYIS